MLYIAMAQAQLFDAIKAGDAAAVNSLLEADPRLAEAKDEKGVSAILTALYYRQPQIAHALREKRDSVDIFEAASLGELRTMKQISQQHPEYLQATSSDGWTALHLAAFFGHAEIVRWLLENDVAVDARSANPMNNTALHAAQVSNHVDVARALLEHGASVNEKQHGGFTALHSAASNGCEPMVELLLEHGANPSLRDDAGKSAADHAAEKKHDPVAQRLRRG